MAKTNKAKRLTCVERERLRREAMVRAQVRREAKDRDAKEIVFVGVVNGVKTYRVLGYQKPTRGRIGPKLRHYIRPLTVGLSDKP